MMIVQSYRIGIIFKLTFFVLAILGFGVATTLAQGNAPLPPEPNPNEPFEIPPDGCGAGKTMNARGECVLDLQKIKPIGYCDSAGNKSSSYCQDLAKQQNTSNSSQYGNCNGDVACEEMQKSLKCRDNYSPEYCNCKITKKGIYLNTDVPFIGRCLVGDDNPNAGVTVLQSLTKILMTFVLIGGFGMIVRGGVQIAADDVKSGKEKIIGVVIAFALLGSLGVILRFINPNFFS